MPFRFKKGQELLNELTGAIHEPLPGDVNAQDLEMITDKAVEATDRDAKLLADHIAKHTGTYSFEEVTRIVSLGIAEMTPSQPSLNRPDMARLLAGLTTTHTSEVQPETQEQIEEQVEEGP